MNKGKKLKLPKWNEKFIVPSVLSADFGCLKNELKKVEKYSGWIQLDVMDGHFVPNLSFGPHIAGCIKNITDLPLDIHLMVEKPSDFIDAFVEQGADIITVHCESENFENALKSIKKYGLKSGIALKPKTEFKNIIKYIDRVDLILIMTVEPGFGGQSFIYDMLQKIKEVRDFLTKNKLKKYIQVDGGINEITLPYALNSGANSFVMGSAVFNKKDNRKIKKMYNLIYGG
ncbi:MAG: ribulose-phosphate 3-epimerase [Elusimicrobiales bacterium]|nr:ribulose-phosphate 3-epimerase [Elusimicrobiales bacterium]HPO96161.1 ribulose-phosphate 3-epimerase [Elusimicrobiales bacterium]